MGKVPLWIVLCIVSSVVFGLLTLSLFLFGPPVWNDEAILTDAAIHLHSKGAIAAPVLKGAIPDIESHFYFYPPLYIGWLSLWIALFGPSIESVRLSSFCIAVVALVIAWAYVWSLTKSAGLASLGVFFLSVNNAFGVASRTARMEIVVVLFLLSVLWQSDRFLLVGVIAAAAVMTHPLGGVVFLAGVVAACVQPSWKRMLAVCLPSIVSVVVWFASMGASFPLFLNQYALQFALKLHQQSDVVSQFTNNRQFTIISFIWLLFVCVLLYVTIFKHKKRYWILVVSSVGALAGAIVGKEFWFDVYPNVCMAIVGMVVIWESRVFSELGRYSVYALAALLLLFEMHMTMQSRNDFLTWTNAYHEVTSRMYEQIPTGKHVFLASIPDPYFDLRNDTSLALYEAPPVPIPIARYRTLLQQMDIVIYTRAPDSFFSTYMKQNAASTIIIYAGRQPVTVVTLVNGQERK